jgi:hypothetical protein
MTKITHNAFAPPPRLRLGKMSAKTAMSSQIQMTNRNAADPVAVVPGAVLVVGTERFWSVVRIEQVDDDGQVHFVAVSAGDPAAARLLARSA